MAIFCVGMLTAVFQTCIVCRLKRNVSIDWHFKGL